MTSNKYECTACQFVLIIKCSFSDPMPESDRVKIAVGTAGLLLGSVVLLAGVIYYKRNRTGERQDKIN